MTPAASSAGTPAEPRRYIFVSACEVCGAQVWTYRRSDDVTRLGPHYGPDAGAKRRREWCSGGCQPLKVQP